MRIHKRWIPDRDSPLAIGQCDYSGFIVPYHELVRQMEYRGNALVWTGFLVWNRFADQPNPQLLDPILKQDPIPLREPRVPQDPDNTALILLDETMVGTNLRMGEGFDEEFTIG